MSSVATGARRPVIVIHLTPAVPLISLLLFNDFFFSSRYGSARIPIYSYRTRVHVGITYCMYTYALMINIFPVELKTEIWHSTLACNDFQIAKQRDIRNRYIILFYFFLKPNVWFMYEVDRQCKYFIYPRCINSGFVLICRYIIHEMNVVIEQI